MRKSGKRLLVAAVTVLALCGGGLWLFRFELQYLRHRALIRAAADRYQADPLLVASLIWQESRFVPERVGLKGEIGLMQIMPASGREWAKAERIAGYSDVALFNPLTNVLAGTWYLTRALRRWDARTDGVAIALAEYNAGPSNARRWAARSDGTNPGAFLRDIGFPTTRRYAQDILRRYESFGKPWQRLLAPD